jgi:N-acetylmuramoyl-L-alanine amidase
MRTALILAILQGLAAAESVVVIDPGHGGSNTGAPGRVAGAWEKQVTLAVARVLQNRLEREGVKVVMTRERDRYLTLRERVRRANAVEADCFLSLHTNASTEHARRGVETYVLSRETVEVEAHRAASKARGVEAVLAELGLVEAHRASVSLATAVLARLQPGQAPRQAGYDVLSGVAAPAVLVEIGFIDHPVEGPLLLKTETQRQIGEQLAEGVFDFLSRHKAARRAPTAQHPPRLSKGSGRLGPDQGRRHLGGVHRLGREQGAAVLEGQR